MRSKHFKLTICTFAVIAIALMVNCGEETIMGPSPQLSQRQGIPTEQITWLKWKPEVTRDMMGLGKIGFAGKMIQPNNGGFIGGNQTLDNRVDIPAGALDDKTFITVEVLCLEGHEQTGAGVEFLPSGQFNKPVTITLSWEYLDIVTDRDALDFKVYYCENSDGDTWYELSPEYIDIDYTNKLVTFLTDHFTRYQWGL